MARKPADIVQPSLRIREDLHRRLEQAAKRRGVSLNYEMTSRLKESFGREAQRKLDMIVADMEEIWARYGQVWHQQDMQAGLLGATEALIAALEQLPEAREHEAIKKAVAQVKQVIEVIEVEAKRRIRTTGGDQ